MEEGLQEQAPAQDLDVVFVNAVVVVQSIS